MTRSNFIKYFLIVVGVIEALSEISRRASLIGLVVDLLIGLFLWYLIWKVIFWIYDKVMGRNRKESTKSKTQKINN